ncbi:hypothetical protein SK128_018863 [Halocaridina rubra]|uniref:Uncharacterized protein n=1 Tax=Halocaridina rubra TaxID=373956 RepID=A0AAN8XGE1_HALRR
MASVWLYAVLLNLALGIVFIVMSAVYYGSCFEGPYPVRTVPAFMFLIGTYDLVFSGTVFRSLGSRGISQMALAVIIPSFKYFLKNISLPDALSLPDQDSKKTAVLFAGLVVALTGLFFTIFVILGKGVTNYVLTSLWRH